MHVWRWALMHAWRWEGGSMICALEVCMNVIDRFFL
jgi:hypothetical protein